MDIFMAPMQGYADDVYIKWHSRVYGCGVKEYFSPFVRMEGGEPRRRDMTRVARCREEGVEVTPQIIFGSVAEFDALVAAIKQAGYGRIDLNLGCPYPMQTGKRRGAAMIANAEVMRQVAERISGDGSTQYSLKMRLGHRDIADWRSLMPILNEVRLRHITVHPRVAKQMYKGELRMDEFAELCAVSANPVVYNGDIFSLEDMRRISADYPSLRAVMVGRGLLGRPSFAAEWTRGEEWPADKRIECIMRLHDALLSDYEQMLCGSVQVLQHIKPFWEYMETEIGHKAHKAIRKSSSLAAYRSAVDMVGR